MLSDEQLQQHNQGIGGTLASSILGFNKYQNNVEAYILLTDDEYRKRQSDSIGSKLSVKVGQLLESLVAETAMNDKGWNLIEPKGTLVDVEFPFLIGHPDRFIEGVQELVEIKTRGNYAMSEYGEQGTDEIMKSDYVQVQFYLMLTGFKRGWLTALMLGEIAEGLCYFPVDRNDEFIALMREECVNFWKNHVLKRIPPSLATYEQASRIYRKSIAGSIVQCNDEIFKAYEKSMKYNETLKSTKLLLDSEKARIAMFMADHEVLTMNNDKPLVTFKAGSRTDFDSKKFEKEQPDLYKQYLRTSPTKTMLFKEIK